MFCALRANVSNIGVNQIKHRSRKILILHPMEIRAIIYSYIFYTCSLVSSKGKHRFCVFPSNVNSLMLPVCRLRRILAGVMIAMAITSIIFWDRIQTLIVLIRNFSFFCPISVITILWTFMIAISFKNIGVIKRFNIWAIILGCILWIRSVVFWPPWILALFISIMSRRETRRITVAVLFLSIFIFILPIITFMNSIIIPFWTVVVCGVWRSGRFMVLRMTCFIAPISIFIVRMLSRPLIDLTLSAWSGPLILTFELRLIGDRLPISRLLGLLSCSWSLTTFMWLALKWLSPAGKGIFAMWALRKLCIAITINL